MAGPHRWRPAWFALACIAVLGGAARAGEPEVEIRELRKQVDELLRRDAEKQRRIEELERRLGAPPAASAASPGEGSAAAEALDRAVEEATAGAPPASPAPSSLAARAVGPATLRLLDLSLDALVAAGGSSEDDETLGSLQAGGHDPKRNGFTVQNVELSAIGAVDPYLTGEAHMIFFLDPETDNETVVELEEAFATTQALPYGLQLEAGHFLTEFGRINPTHPHAWKWIDQPVINTRLFGADGMRNPGFRVGWLLPVSWFSQAHFGMQDATGETMPSFLGGSVEHAHGAEEEAHGLEEEAAHAELERGIGGRPIFDRDVRGLDDFVYLARFENGADLTDEWSGKLGFSGLFGPNATGDDGETRIYGADLVVKWRRADNFRGWPFFLWESEVSARDFEADRFADADDLDLALGGKTLHDWGFYSQGLYGFAVRWAAGLRVEYATGDGETLETGRDADAFRDDRLRLSPLLVFDPSEFSRLRLQYNFDDADHLDDHAHSVWLGLEFLYGVHPAHSY